MKRTSLAAIAALVLGAVLIFAVNLTSAPQAGATPVPDFNEGQNGPDAAGNESLNCDDIDGENDDDGIGDAPEAREANANETEECLAALNNATDLGLPLGTQAQVFEVEAETSGGGPTATGRLSVEYPEPFDASSSKVIVGIDLVRNVENQNNFPVISQATEQSPTGFNVRLLNKEIEGIDSEVVRFQVTAIALPSEPSE